VYDYRGVFERDSGGTVGMAEVVQQGRTTLPTYSCLRSEWVDHCTMVEKGTTAVRR